MEYTSTVKFESTTNPGVVYTLKRMSHGRRIALNASTAKILTKINEIQDQISPIDKEIQRAEDAVKIEPCGCNGKAHEHDTETLRCKTPGCSCRTPQPDSTIGDYTTRAKLQLDLITVISDELYPAYIRWAWVECQGLTIDGKPATADLLLESGDERLVAELGSEVQRTIRLGPDEVLGFKPPTTSDAVADQANMVQSVASNVSVPASTNSGTAAATSPAN